MARATYKVENEGQEPFTFATKAGIRIHDTLRALINGPVPAPSKRRVSDHILKMRQAGILIETEMVPQRERGADKFGLYHLRSRVTPVAGGTA